MTHLSHPTPGWIDHLLVVLIAGVWPLVETRWFYPRSQRAVAAGVPGSRLRLYRNLILPSWLFTASILALWLATGRAWGLLFVRFGTPIQTAIGAGIAALFLLALRLQQRQIAARPALLPTLRGQMAFAEPIMPHTDAERRRFRVVAITAGITEELMFRGFVFWYFNAWAGPVVAVLASAILFGVGHLYMGMAQAPKTAIGGLIASLVALASGSLWPAIVMHAAVDLENGELGFRVFGPEAAAAGPPPVDLPPPVS